MLSCARHGTKECVLIIDCATSTDLLLNCFCCDKGTVNKVIFENFDGKLQVITNKKRMLSQTDISNICQTLENFASALTNELDKLFVTYKDIYASFPSVDINMNEHRFKI